MNSENSSSTKVSMKDNTCNTIYLCSSKELLNEQIDEFSEDSISSDEGDKLDIDFDFQELSFKSNNIVIENKENIDNSNNNNDYDYLINNELNAMNEATANNEDKIEKSNSIYQYLRKRSEVNVKVLNDGKETLVEFK
jgi:hypothetical protein